MAKWLLVGDPHAVVDELEDCQNLIKGLLEVVRATRPDCVVFLGDQHHNHAIVHVDVMGFWRESFHLLTEVGKVKVYALVGNHDMPGDGVSRNHAMMAYADMPNVTVVDSPVRTGDVLLCPYFPRGDDLRTAVIANPLAKVIICHQTIVGSRYENGFIAQDGVSLERLEDKFFISGHIHTPQKYDNVVYVGAPRWRNFFDADVERALSLWDIQDGKAVLVELFDTSRWCKKLVHVMDSEAAPFQGEPNPAWRYIVDIIGSQSFIESRRGRWAGQRVRAVYTEKAVAGVVCESMGVSKAIEKFVDLYQPRFGTKTEVLRAMVAERI